MYMYRITSLEQVLRLEYRSKFLNPKWRDAMLQQGSGGAYEVSQRFTAMVGWAATAEVDNFVFDQAAERYALDEEVAKKLQKSNPGKIQRNICNNCHASTHLEFPHNVSFQCVCRGFQECSASIIRGKW